MNDPNEATLVKTVVVKSIIDDNYEFQADIFSNDEVVGRVFSTVHQSIRSLSFTNGYIFIDCMTEHHGGIRSFNSKCHRRSYKVDWLSAEILDEYEKFVMDSEKKND